MPAKQAPLPVLVVGNGPVGLLTALALAKQDGECGDIPRTCCGSVGAQDVLDTTVTSPSPRRQRMAMRKGRC